MSPGLRWSSAFGPEPGAAARARGAARDVLLARGVDVETVARAVLVVGELASNAVRHARTEFALRMTLDGGTLRVEVVDRDTRPPALLGLDDESTSGRGLHIVAAVARDWGWQTAETDEGESGKVVWAELAVEPPGGPPGGR